jgi:hypothetical protein
MMTWSEVLRKEKSKQKVYENFTINPRRCKNIILILRDLY